MTQDKLFGAAAAYLMIGVFWAYLYAIIGFFYPQSYMVVGNRDDSSTPMRFT